MPRQRSAAQWERLSEAYRKRLVRQGISREDYVSGAKLQAARGQSREKVHDRQRYLIKKYGPYDIEGDPLITPKLLKKARHERGEEWVTERLEKLTTDYQKSAMSHGEPVHPGDPKYSRLANEKKYREGVNPYAPFYWYHGVFG